MTLRKQKRPKLKKGVRFTILMLVILSSILVYQAVGKGFLESLIKPVVSLSEQLTHQPDSELKQQWQDILTDQDANVNIAVYNHKTGQTTAFSNNTSATYYTASIIKVAVLANLLNNHEDNNTSLSADEQTLAQDMITLSDNEATTTLLNTYQGGYTAPNRLFNQLDMTHTKMSTAAWGLSTTTAADQIKLLNALAYGTKSPLDQADRNYVLQLMANVAPDQAWGMSSELADNAQVELKNGWLALDNGWVVNTIGHVKTKNSNYTIAVLTNGNATQDQGIDLIESLAAVTVKQLNAD
ncbi:serine hydrolase [Leuconostoc lactis]|uniref:serine hydrolase n=1 Tax=Leuconostoc lactis TaxID=1246 RepID=UPI0028A0BE0A|nr:serine hydrolase [Leuconostoc lactis]